MRQTSMQVEWSDGSRESDFNSLLGERVRVHGLQAKPEYNGEAGRVYSFDHERGRAGVHLDSGPGLWIKPNNLKKLAREEPDGPSAGKGAASTVGSIQPALNTGEVSPRLKDGMS